MKIYSREREKFVFYNLKLIFLFETQALKMDAEDMKHEEGEDEEHDPAQDEEAKYPNLDLKTRERVKEVF